MPDLEEGFADIFHVHRGDSDEARLGIMAKLSITPSAVPDVQSVQEQHRERDVVFSESFEPRSVDNRFGALRMSDSTDQSEDDLDIHTTSLASHSTQGKSVNRFGALLCMSDSSDSDDDSSDETENTSIHFCNPFSALDEM